MASMSYHEPAEDRTKPESGSTDKGSVQVQDKPCAKPLTVPACCSTFMQEGHCFVWLS